MAISVRPLRRADLSRAAAALVAVHARDGYPVEGVTQPEAWLTPSGLLRSWVAERAAEAEIVGHVAVSSPQGEEAVELFRRRAGGDGERVAVLARLFVHPSARRNSAGERLVRAATEYGRAHGTRLVLDVLTKDTAAIRLYERLGWERLGEAQHAYGNGRRTAALCYVSPPPEA